MKSETELQQFYNTVLLPQLQELEKARLEASKKVVWAFSIIGSITGVLFLLTFKSRELPVIILFLGFMAGLIAYKVCTGRYVSDFKARIIDQIVQFLNPDLEYDSEGSIPFDLFKKSKIFLSDIDRYSGEDLVMGKIGATEFGFSEVHAQDERQGDKGRRYYVTIFKGMFFVADFNKHFQGRTFVLPDSAEKVFGGLGKALQGWNISRPDLVKLEDVEFERHFVVYSTDQTEARYILSPSLMKRMLDFKVTTGRRLYFSFVDSSVHIAIPLTKNMFEPKLFKTILNFQPILEYYKDLMLGVGIVEELSLNTRIWSKS